MAAIQLAGVIQNDLIDSIDKRIIVSSRNTQINSNNIFIGVLGTVITDMIFVRFNSINWWVVRRTGTSLVPLISGTPGIGDIYKLVEVHVTKRRVHLFLNRTFLGSTRVLGSDWKGKGIVLAVGVNDVGGSQSKDVAFDNLSVRKICPNWYKTED